jgi:hypothetical protein
MQWKASKNQLYDTEADKLMSCKWEKAQKNLWKESSSFKKKHHISELSKA